MEYSILFVDDERSVHIVLEKMLGTQFNIIHAYNAQEAIDIISEKAISLLLCDIEMPGMNGLELLESIQKDYENRNIPFLILTSHDSNQTRKEAYDLGAADFISKMELTQKREDFLERVRMKLVSNVNLPDLDDRLVTSKNQVIKEIMRMAIRKKFKETAQSAIESIIEYFDISYGALFVRKEREEWKQVYDYPESLSVENVLDDGNLWEEQTFKEALASHESVLNNNISSENIASLKNVRSKNKLPSKLGIPLFAMSEKGMLMQNLEVTKDVPIFGYVLLLGDKLVSTKEFELLSKLVIQSGSILWRLFQTTNHE